MGYMEDYNEWLSNSYFDEETKKELKGIAGDEKEIEERFYKELEFGTGGLRGIIGAGTNRMNIYTVRKASQGLADYIIKNNGQDKGVAIAYDCRFMSPEFADVTALCLAANGVKAYVFDALRPTPELSFALRELHCIAGVVVTASHNPPEYNGYKIYDRYGCAVLCKGGHRINDANDYLYDGKKSVWLYGKRIDNPNTHGTGCTLSSAIASNLAKGADLETAVRSAKAYISGALGAMLDLGKGSGPMNHAFAIKGDF